jgi:hypothetical protein
MKYFFDGIIRSEASYARYGKSLRDAVDFYEIHLKSEASLRQIKLEPFVRYFLIAKDHQRRIMPMESNLIEWLKPYRPVNGQGNRQFVTTVRPKHSNFGVKVRAAARKWLAADISLELKKE